MQIFVPTSDGKGTVGTGYPVAPGRILTARHVLFPPNRDPDRPMQVRWYHQDGQLRDWKEVKKIHWHGGEEIDVAVFECLFPAGAETYGRLNRAKPSNRDSWEGAGFAIAGEQDNGRSPPVPLGGKVLWVADNEWQFQLGEDYATNDEFLWQGVSGGPVFSGNGIIGVIVSAPKAFGGRRFYAIPTWKLLTIAGFAQAIGGCGQQDTPIKRDLWFLSSLVKTDAQAKQIKLVIPDRSRLSAFKATACVFTDFDVECPDSLGFKLIHQLGGDQLAPAPLTLSGDSLGSRKPEEVLWELLGDKLIVPSVTAEDIKKALTEEAIKKALTVEDIKKALTEANIKNALLGKQTPMVFELDIDRQVHNHAWIAGMAEAWEKLTCDGEGHQHCLILSHKKPYGTSWWRSGWLNGWRRCWLRFWVFRMQGKLSQAGRVIKPDRTPALRKAHLYAWIRELRELEPQCFDDSQQSELEIRTDKRFKSNKPKSYLDIRIEIKEDILAVLQPAHSGRSS